MSQVLLDAAHSYTAAGLSVLPIRPADKLPLHALLPTDERGRHIWEPFQQALPDDGGWRAGLLRARASRARRGSR